MPPQPLPLVQPAQWIRCDEQMNTKSRINFNPKSWLLKIINFMILTTIRFALFVQHIHLSLLSACNSLLQSNHIFFSFFGCILPSAKVIYLFSIRLRFSPANNNNLIRIVWMSLCDSRSCFGFEIRHSRQNYLTFLSNRFLLLQIASFIFPIWMEAAAFNWMNKNILWKLLLNGGWWWM